ncbi:uncharacterized protein LOC143541145 [Bidens hawaiensis]|uniref:uncharacterized protein LOC143541145 n=1 Tax=Bidens hawaiensis TaxID=980011 RepID=UPI00404AC852
MAAENGNFQVPSVPTFDGDYDHWRLVMKTLLKSKEYWVVIDPGYNEPTEGTVLPAAERVQLEQMRLKDLKAQNYLFQSIGKQILKTITQKDTSKQIWEAMKTKYQESKDIDCLSVDELQSSLLVHEQKLTKKHTPDDQVLQVEHDPSTGRGRGRGRGYGVRGRGRGRGRGRSDYDKSSVECYRCHQLGHFAYECTRGEKSVNYTEFDEGEDLLLMTHATVTEELPTTGSWFLDSACSNHMTGSRKWFINLDENFTHSVKLGNDLRLIVKGIGDIRFEAGGITQVITRVYYVPDLTSNLLSIGQLQEKDLMVVIHSGVCKIYHPQRGLITTSIMTKNRMFVVQAKRIEKENICMQWFWSEAANWACHILNHCATTSLEERVPEESHNVTLNHQSEGPPSETNNINSESDISLTSHPSFPIVQSHPSSPIIQTREATVGESSKRTRSAPTWMHDYESGDGLSNDEADFVMFSSLEDPTTYEEAVKETIWVNAMEKEMESIMKNETWELVDAPAGVTPIGVKWLYKTKLNEKGEVDKYKARLVVKGYAQKKGIDYDEVFAPVARWDTVHSIIAIAAQKGWLIQQMDVKCAFLNGTLKETVYIQQPQGFIKKGEATKVCKLNKALYGLKQAPRAWFKRIESYFLKEGFKKSCYDHTLFIKKLQGDVIIMSLYVDDMLFTGNNRRICEEFKDYMKHEFEMTDLGKMRYFLGIEVIQSEAGIAICQKKYARSVLERFNMWEANGVKNPIVPGVVVTKQGVGNKVDETEFKSLVGSLMYLTVTRPDLMYSVCFIARFMANPREEHLLLAKRILRCTRIVIMHEIQKTENVHLGMHAFLAGQPFVGVQRNKI